MVTASERHNCAALGARLDHNKAPSGQVVLDGQSDVPLDVRLDVHLDMRAAVRLRAWTHAVVGVLLAFVLSFWPFAAARAQYAAPCTIVFGHGRNAVQNEAASAAFWDGINRALAQQVAASLQANGTRVVLFVMPTAFTDVPAIVASLLERAARERCTRVVETTLFGNDDETLVVRLRAYPVVRTEIGTDADTSAMKNAATRFGEPLYSDQQEYADTQRNRDRLVPAELGRTLAARYLQSAAKQ